MKIWHSMVKILLSCRKSDHFSYFENLERIAQPNYVPSAEDILRSRSKTAGVTRSILTDREHESTRIDVYDFGGARNLRKTWEPYFRRANIVVFVAPIDAYHRCLVEDLSGVSASCGFYPSIGTDGDIRT